MHEGLEISPRVQEGVHIYTYSRSNGDFHARNVRIGGGEIIIDFVHPNGIVTDIKLGVPLSVNIDNGIAAMAIAWLCGVTEEELREGMASFRGVERRFDFKLKTDAKVYLSDYAHHPAEIRQSAQSIRELYAGRKVTAIFQPHLYSRTQDFYSEFAESLSLFDEVILTDIYPAREEPIPGVSSKLIYDHLKPSVQKLMIGKSEVVATVEAKKNDIEVLVTLGAGDIENYAAEITQILKS
jgi:UDP-N-acetylmuramate--alanine ligase